MVFLCFDVSTIYFGKITAVKGRVFIAPGVAAAQAVQGFKIQIGYSHRFTIVGFYLGENSVLPGSDLQGAIDTGTTGKA